MIEQPQTPVETDLERRTEWRAAGVICFGLFSLLILYAAFRIIWPFMTAILIGAILVTLTFGTFRRVRERMGGGSAKAALAMLLGITFLILIPATIIAVMLVQQANVVIESLQSVDAKAMIARIDIAQYLEPIKKIAPQFDPKALSPGRLLLPALQGIPGWVARHGGAIVGGVAGGLLGFALVLLTMFFFYVEGEEILRQLSILSPLPKRYDREFAARFKDVIDATFRGQLFTGLAQGMMTFIGLLIVQIPGAGFWGAVAALLSLIPMFAAAVWLPTAVYLVIAASMGARPWWQAIFMILWGVIPVSLVDNVVRPWAMKGKAQLPAIPLIFAVIGGMKAFGFVGLVIGPLVFSLLMSIIAIYKSSFAPKGVEGVVETVSS